MKYYVVADVHGFYSRLIATLKEKGWFENKGNRKLILCGDAFDRGEEAVEMQAFLARLLEEDELIFIRGNHEDLMVEFIENIGYWMDSRIVYSHHWSNGTVETMLQLTGLTLNEAYVQPKRAVGMMRQTPFFKKLLPATQNYFETENYLFVHGWFPCKAHGDVYRPSTFAYRKNWRQASEKDWEYARWYNGMEAAAQGVIEKGKTVVCGHWRCSYGHAVLERKGKESGVDADYSPYYGDGIIAIDACTKVSKKVNCLVIEE